MPSATTIRGHLQITVDDVSYGTIKLIPEIDTNGGMIEINGYWCRKNGRDINIEDLSLCEALPSRLLDDVLEETFSGANLKPHVEVEIRVPGGYGDFSLFRLRAVEMDEELISYEVDADMSGDWSGFENMQLLEVVDGAVLTCLEASVRGEINEHTVEQIPYTDDDRD